MREVFPETVGKGSLESDSETSLEQGLAALAAGGWLEDDGSGYAMHPLIAQCLRRKILTEERLEPVLGNIRTRLLRENPIGRPQSESEEFQRICHTFLSVCRLLSGSVSRELMLAVLTALLYIRPVRQDAEEYQRWMAELMKRCPERDDQTEVLLCVVLGRLGLGDTAQFAFVYHSQKERLTVPMPLFLEFCIYAGDSLACRREFALAEQLPV